MLDAIALVLGAIFRLFRTRQTLGLENLALRQQLTTLKRRHPRLRLSEFDRLFWVLVRPVRTSFQSPWQNGIAERWIESCRRDLLDHVIAASERHLKRLLSDYIRYYHEDRPHLGLNKGTPVGTVRSLNQGAVVSHARMGGLHHRYDRAA